MSVGFFIVVYLLATDSGLFGGFRGVAWDSRVFDIGEGKIWS